LRDLVELMPIADVAKGAVRDVLVQRDKEVLIVRHAPILPVLPE